MRKQLITAAVAALLTTGSAHASSIFISVFDLTTFDEQTTFSGGGVIEDFEDASTLGGIAPNAEYASITSSKVGTFTPFGGTGAGSTCGTFGTPACTGISYSTLSPNDQGNLIPDTTGIASLNSTDTLGINWDVSYEGGKEFNKVVFAIQDAVDQAASLTLSVTASGGGLATLDGKLVSGNKQLVVVDFGTLVTSATITISNNNDNPDDAFSIDGASVGVVPIPAAGLLLLGGLGALGALRARKKA